MRGDASKAEASFFKINQEATPINPTELRILNARRKPNAIATRALIHAGTGHKYWSAFDPLIKTQIEGSAREVYQILFEPSLETPIKTLDLPVAGRGYSASSFELIFELINSVNKPLSGAVVEDDVDGTGTLEYLNRVRQLTNLLSGTSPESLGLHPAVYFYSATGRYQPATFLAVVQMLETLEKTDGFFGFTKVRARFENFLIQYRHFINQIVRKLGSGTRASPFIHSYYEHVLKCFQENPESSAEDIVLRLWETKHFEFLNDTEEYEQAGNKKFSTSAKSATFLREALESSLCCQICGARIHRKSISVDHIVRRADGGAGDSENAQLAHPYCNTGYKEKLDRMAKQQAKTDAA